MRIKRALKQSYHPNQHGQLKDWMQDKELSGKRAQVYTSPRSNHVLVVHRGSQGPTDWLRTNPQLAFGRLPKTQRGQHAIKITKAAVAKYPDAENVTVAGHSLGGALARETGKRVKGVDNVITVNSAGPLFMPRRRLDKEVEYRSAFDPVSLVAGGTGNKGRLITDWSGTWNPHSVEAGLGV